MFFAGRIYQGAEGKIYPYPLYDTILDVHEDKTYQAYYLENKYVNKHFPWPWYCMEAGFFMRSNSQMMGHGF